MILTISPLGLGDTDIGLLSVLVCLASVCITRILRQCFIVVIFYP